MSRGIPAAVGEDPSDVRLAKGWETVILVGVASRSAGLLIRCDVGGNGRTLDGLLYDKYSTGKDRGRKNVATPTPALLTPDTRPVLPPPWSTTGRTGIVE